LALGLKYFVFSWSCLACGGVGCHNDSEQATDNSEREDINIADFADADVDNETNTDNDNQQAAASQSMPSNAAQGSGTNCDDDEATSGTNCDDAEAIAIFNHVANYDVCNVCEDEFAFTLLEECARCGRPYCGTCALAEVEDYVNTVITTCQDCMTGAQSNDASNTQTEAEAEEILDVSVNTLSAETNAVGPAQRRESGTVATVNQPLSETPHAARAPLALIAIN
jgi:hypothetical protein